MKDEREREAGGRAGVEVSDVSNVSTCVPVYVSTCLLVYLFSCFLLWLHTQNPAREIHVQRPCASGGELLKF